MAVGLGQRLIIIRSLLFVVNYYFEFFCFFFLRVFFLLITYFYSTIVLTFNKSNLFWSSCISNANIVFHLIYINLKLVFIIALSIAIRV